MLWLKSPVCRRSVSMLTDMGNVENDAKNKKMAEKFCRLKLFAYLCNRK